MASLPAMFSSSRLSWPIKSSQTRHLCVHCLPPRRQPLRVSTHGFRKVDRFHFSWQPGPRTCRPQQHVRRAAADAAQPSNADKPSESVPQQPDEPKPNLFQRFVQFLASLTPKAESGRLLRDVLQLFRRFGWAVLLLFLARDALQFLLHRVTHRLTNWAAEAVFEYPISASVINPWWLMLDAQFLETHSGYQLTMVVFFLIALPLNLLLNCGSTAIMLKLCTKDGAAGTAQQGEAGSAAAEPPAEAPTSSSSSSSSSSGGGSPSLAPAAGATASSVAAESTPTTEPPAAPPTTPNSAQPQPPSTEGSAAPDPPPQPTAPPSSSSPPPAAATNGSDPPPPAGGRSPPLDPSTSGAAAASTPTNGSAAAPPTPPAPSPSADSAASSNGGNGGAARPAAAAGATSGAAAATSSNGQGGQPAPAAAAEAAAAAGGAGVSANGAGGTDGAAGAAVQQRSNNGSASASGQAPATAAADSPPASTSATLTPTPATTAVDIPPPATPTSTPTTTAADTTPASTSATSGNPPASPPSPAPAPLPSPAPAPAPIRGPRAALAEIRAALPAVWQIMGRIWWVELLASGASLLLQGLMNLLLPIFWALPALLSIQLALTMAVLQGHKGLDALRQSQQLMQGYRVAYFWPFLALLLLVRFVDTLRAAAFAMMPNRLWTDAIEIPIAVYALVALLRFTVCRLQDLLPLAAFLRLSEQKQQPQPSLPPVTSSTAVSGSDADAKPTQAPA